MTRRCDVAVVGGGPAGVAAACNAAEAGAHTLLVEPAARLGGNVSQAFVHTICGLYLGDEALTPANPGFPLRFYEALRRRGAAGPPERVGRVWVVALVPLGFAAQAAESIAGFGAAIERVEGAVVHADLGAAAGAPSVLRVRGDRGDGADEQEISARAIVDASGEGVLGPLGGADHDSAPDAELQACSYIALLSGVPATATEGFARMQLSVAIAKASRTGALPDGCASVLLRPGPSPGEAFVTLGLPRLDGEPYSPLDPGYRARAGEAAASSIERLVAHLRAERDGFEACAVAASPARIGVREGRRLLGGVVMSEADVLSGRSDAAAVARSSWPIELWVDHLRARFQYPSQACDIPLGALASRSHPMLAMAGRCISASHEALGAVRVIGTALATGAAAGRAAALAADAGVAIGDVDPRRVRAAAQGGEAERR